MKNIIKAKGTTVTPSIQNYIDKRFSKFNKYAPDDTVVNTKIEVKEGGNRHKVEITIFFGKQVVRAEANSTNMYVTIDNAEKVMSGLLKKRKEKLLNHRNQIKSPHVDTNKPFEYIITREKNHELTAMTTQEACEAMEMTGHTFYAYLDDDTKNIAIVYKRNDNTIGKLMYGQYSL